MGSMEYSNIHVYVFPSSKPKFFKLSYIFFKNSNFELVTSEICFNLSLWSCFDASVDGWVVLLLEFQRPEKDYCDDLNPKYIYIAC